MGHTHRYKFGFEKKTGKESQYMVSHPELGSDPPIGSDRESGCDKMYQDLRRQYYWSGMKRHVGDFVRRCLTCQQVKVEH